MGLRNWKGFLKKKFNGTWNWLTRQNLSKKNLVNPKGIIKGIKILNLDNLFNAHRISKKFLGINLGFGPPPGGPTGPTGDGKWT